MLEQRHAFDSQLFAPKPMILLRHIHYSRASDLERPDLLTVDPVVPL